MTALREILGKPSSIETLHMTPAQWREVADNPRQRDTESRAKKAVHLREFRESHAVVHAGRLPDKTLIKLDGHTRSHLWQMREIDAPPTLLVIVYRCKDIEAAAELYDTFDSPDAVEDATDKIYGSTRELRLNFQSDLLRSCRYASAIRGSYEFLESHIAARKMTLSGLQRYWLVELSIIDKCGPTSKRFTSGVLAGALLTFYRYGETASEFWKAYASRQGSKVGEEMDAVQALDQLVTERFHGVHHTSKIIPYVLAAFERHLTGQPYSVHGSIRALGANAIGQWTLAAKKAKQGRSS